MFDVYLDDPKRVVEFVAARIEHFYGRPFPDNATGIGVTRDGDLIGGFVYANWHPEHGTIEASAASDDKRWLTRHTLFHLHAYPFLSLGCQMIVTQTSATFTDLLREHCAYGYKTHTIPRLFGRDHDGVITRLTFEDWHASPFTQSYLRRINPNG